MSVNCTVVCVRQCLPLWPESSTGKLCVRVVGSESTSKSFFFNKQDNGTLMRMDQVGISAGVEVWHVFIKTGQVMCNASCNVDAVKAETCFLLTVWWCNSGCEYLRPLHCHQLH